MKYLQHVVVASALAAVGSVATASINFERPYFFVSEADARKGVPFTLYGSRDGSVSYVSVRVYKWKQAEGSADELVPADDMAVFPQMVRTEANARVNVRLQWKPKASAGKEAYYRIVMEEFDRPDGTNAESGKASFGLKVRPRVSIPFVIYSAGEIAPAQLMAKSAPVQQGAMANKPEGAGIEFALSNSGETYAKLFGFRAADGKTYPLGGYVLPGVTIKMSVPGLSSAEGGSFLYASGRAEHVRKSDVPLRTAVAE